ncbi:hypothetical protein B0H14DRAFT_3051279 [Mycena olivaceomarginata]|nr:hypothetical protein B0H14DRAFT_3051279 [Mycena olivaceomarginata]
MAPRLALHSQRNRRWGLKYPFKIFKGDLVVDFEEEDVEEPHPTADVDMKEGSEHHLQAVLATKAAFIPTPGTIRIIDNQDPGNRTWVDPISYLKTTQTCEEACSNALIEHEYNYFMDEIDKQWLDTNNERAREEGTTTAQSDGAACRGKVVSISEDEFELVMALLEKITDQKGFRDDRADFPLYEPFFSDPLPSTMFASYVTPSWIPPPALVVQIARTVYEHWKQRRSLSKGRKLRPSLNYDESGSLDEAYICFRHNTKTVCKTRASLVNNAPKLARLDRDLQQVLEIAKALLTRETVKHAAAAQSYKVWRARLAIADLLHKFPTLFKKTDEAPLFDEPQQVKFLHSSFSKVNVPAPSLHVKPSTILPSDRCAAINQEIMKRTQEDLQELVDHCQVDVTDDPYQPCPVPRADTMWVDVSTFCLPDVSVRANHYAVRLRYGRGGRRFLDRRTTFHPYPTQLRDHRLHAGNDFDEEAARRLHAQWRFDEDSNMAFEEEHSEVIDECDTREAALVTDAPTVRDMRTLPEVFTASATTQNPISPHSSPRTSGQAAMHFSPSVVMQENVFLTSTDHASRPRSVTSLLPAEMQENICPQPGSAPSPVAHLRPRTDILAHHRRDDVPRASLVKIGSFGAERLADSPSSRVQLLQANGPRNAGYVMSASILTRAPAQPSPLTTYSVTASELAS